MNRRQANKILGSIRLPQDRFRWRRGTLNRAIDSIYGETERPGVLTRLSLLGDYPWKGSELNGAIFKLLRHRDPSIRGRRLMRRFLGIPLSRFRALPGRPPRSRQALILACIE
jgi:hypothetical protein